MRSVCQQQATSAEVSAQLQANIQATSTAFQNFLHIVHKRVRQDLVPAVFDAAAGEKLLHRVPRCRFTGSGEVICQEAQTVSPWPEPGSILYPQAAACRGTDGRCPLV